VTRDTKNPEAIGIMSRAGTASFRHFTEQARHLSNTGAEKQSRRMSLVEAVANVLVGYGVAVLTQIIVFPLFGLRVSLGENLAIGALFTLASIARSYALRRVFEAIRVHTVQAQTAGPEPTSR
jgi:hypothetical protein